MTSLMTKAGHLQKITSTWLQKTLAGGIWEKRYPSITFFSKIESNMLILSTIKMLPIIPYFSNTKMWGKKCSMVKYGISDFPESQKS